MKIFQIIQKPQARGVELFTCMLSEKLQELGHVVILISIFEGNYDLPFSGKQIHLKRSIKNRFWDLKAWNQLAKLIEEEKSDIIQANAADTLKFSVFSKKIFGWKTPIIFRNASQVSQYISNALIKGYNKFLYKNVAGVISVSQKSKEDFSSLFNLDLPHLVIPIGINISDLNLEYKQVEYPVLVHIGGFTFEKNHTELIDIFSVLHQQFPNLKLWLIGEGPLKNEIKSKVQSLGLQDSILFKGTVTAPFQTIPKNSVLVLPSIIEGLPSVILEAFAYQIPVIAYNVGGISEVLTKKTGWLIQSGDHKAFNTAVHEVLHMDEFEKAEITESAFKLVIEHFSVELIAKQFEQFYLEVISTKSRNLNYSK